jgi:hypothetical protein
MYPLRRCCSDSLPQLVADSGVGAGWSQSSSEIRRAVQAPCPQSPYPKPPLRGHELAGVRHDTETAGIRTFVRKISPNPERLLACQTSPDK